jgi:hypothetical protein
MPRKNAHGPGYKPTNTELLATYGPTASRDKRKRGWFWIHNLVVDEWGAQLGPLALACYMALVRHANADAESWPSKRTLAEEIGASKRAVSYAIARLSEFELIDVTYRTDPAGDPTSNLYLILEPLTRTQYEARQAERSGQKASPPTDASNANDPSAAPKEDLLVPGELVQLGSPLGAPHALPVVQEVHHGDAPHALPVVHEVHYPPPATAAEPTEFAGEKNPQIWDIARNHLRWQLPRSTFDTWLTDIDCYSEDDGHTLTLVTNNAYACEWLNLRLTRLITRTLTGILGFPPTLKVICGQNGPGPQHA